MLAVTGFKVNNANKPILLTRPVFVRSSPGSRAAPTGLTCAATSVTRGRQSTARAKPFIA